MSNRVSREDYKKLKEIEEARKAGTLAPEVDREGNMINPHMPEYMSKAPWYLNQEADEGLKHQRFKKKRDDTAGGLFEAFFDVGTHLGLKPSGTLCNVLLPVL